MKTKIPYQFLLFSLLLGILLLAGCVDKSVQFDYIAQLKELSPDSAEYTAELYVLALAKGDFETVNELCAKSSGATLPPPEIQFAQVFLDNNVKNITIAGARETSGGLFDFFDAAENYPQVEDAKIFEVTMSGVGEGESYSTDVILGKEEDGKWKVLLTYFEAS
jgi:hypothetical protein